MNNRINAYWSVVASIAMVATAAVNADNHASGIEACMEAHSQMQLGSWEGRLQWMTPTAGGGFEWEGTITKVEGGYHNAVKNITSGQSFTNRWTNEAVVQIDSPAWISEEKVTTYTEYCNHDQNGSVLQRRWVGTSSQNGAILENVDQMTVAGGRWHWTIATRPAGSDEPLNVWWSSMGQKVE